MTEMSSRERMLRALKRGEPDRVPCCFMSFTALRKRCREDFFELVLAERRMGLDSMLFIPAASRPERREHPDLRGLPVRFSPEVTVRQWSESAGKGTEGALHREYRTPAGLLTTTVRLSEDWPHGDFLPFIDDYSIPRCEKPLVSESRDLEALQFLLVPPNSEDRARYLKEAESARAFVEKEGVLLTGGWGVGVDMADWLCGMERFMIHSMDQPEFARGLLEMIHQWNLRRMELVLAGGVDLYIRRAWYEGCDFLTPQFHRQVVLPRIKAEVDLAHERGSLFGYICSSGTMPFLDAYVEAGIDVLIGVDPVQGTYTDLPAMKSKMRGKTCLWGGVSGAVTVEMGTEEEVRTAVRHALKTLGPEGFVLCPVDNITVDSPQTWRNVEVFIQEWNSFANSESRIPNSQF